MTALLDTIAASGRPLLWLEHATYSGGLLAAGNIPWLDVSALVAWQRKAQGLLKPDVATLPLEPLIGAWLQQHPQLTAAMGQKRRALYPLKTLLADEALRAHVAEALSGLRSCFPKLPLALVIPSPRSWPAQAYGQALGSVEGVEIGADEIDSAAMYIADFLRRFGDSGIDALLLEEAPEAVPASAAEIEWYRPLLNVCAHYRWSCGLRFPRTDGKFESVEGVSFIIAPVAVTTVVAGISVPDSFWSDGVVPQCPPGGFRFAEIAADANPEAVLERLAALR
ncbi:MAG: hypothetical protein ACRETM_05985 [Stenotrophobium sp.]